MNNVIRNTFNGALKLSIVTKSLWRKTRKNRPNCYESDCQRDRLLQLQSTLLSYFALFKKDYVSIYRKDSNLHSFLKNGKVLFFFFSCYFGFISYKLFCLSWLNKNLIKQNSITDLFSPPVPEVFDFPTKPLWIVLKYLIFLVTVLNFVIKILWIFSTLFIGLWITCKHTNLILYNPNKWQKY